MSPADAPLDAGRTLLSRIIAIMDAFNGDEEVLSLGDLTELADLPKSTVHRLATGLRDAGWLEHDVHGYRIGMRLCELGGLALHRLRDSASPHLHGLSTRANLAAQLAVLDGADIVLLDRVLVSDYSLPTRLGERMPAYCTGLGKALLAFDPGAAEAVANSRLHKRTSSTITDPVELHAHLADVRDSGLAYDRSESYEGLGCIAAPIRDAGRAVGAVSVTAPVDRMNWNATAMEVRRTAVDISAALADGRSSSAAEGGRYRSRYTVQRHAKRLALRRVEPTDRAGDMITRAE